MAIHTLDQAHSSVMSAVYVDYRPFLHCDSQTVDSLAVRMRALRSLVALAILTFAASSAVRAQDCYQSAVVSPSPMLGNNGEIVKLLDGSVWEIKYEYEYLYEYNPTILVCPSRGKLIIGEKSLNVQQISSGTSARSKNSKTQTQPAATWEIYEETNIAGTISGTVKQGSIFKTVSGNVYEVTGITLQLVLELQPEVMVLRNGETYKLVIKGFDEPLICRKLN